MAKTPQTIHAKIIGGILEFVEGGATGEQKFLQRLEEWERRADSQGGASG